MDINEARKFIGDSGRKYPDEEILKIVSTLEMLANIAIDRFLQLTPEERKQFQKK